MYVAMHGPAGPAGQIYFLVHFKTHASRAIKFDTVALSIDTAHYRLVREQTPLSVQSPSHMRAFPIIQM